MLEWSQQELSQWSGGNIDIANMWTKKKNQRDDLFVWQLENVYYLHYVNVSLPPRDVCKWRSSRLQKFRYTFYLLFQNEDQIINFRVLSLVL